MGPLAPLGLECQGRERLPALGQSCNCPSSYSLKRGPLTCSLRQGNVPKMERARGITILASRSLSKLCSFSRLPLNPIKSLASGEPDEYIPQKSTSPERAEQSRRERGEQRLSSIFVLQFGPFRMVKDYWLKVRRLGF